MTENGHLGPREHLLLLGCIYAAGALLTFAPHTVMELHYHCLLSLTTGIRCPFCGMTRDFVLMAKGFLPVNNPGSLFIALAGYVVYPAWLLVAALCRPSALRISREKVRKAVMASMAVLFLCNNLVG